jgi:hypothetical protein
MDAFSVCLILLWLVVVQMYHDARRMTEAKRKREMTR